VLVLAVLGTLVLGGAPADAAPKLGPTYRVTGVSDGDTIKVAVGGRVERVRLIGIDTPELGRNGAPDQCYARAARSQMQKLTNGRRVHLVRDSTQSNRDAYGRLLRYVYTAKGTDDVARTLIKRGAGRQYSYDTRYRHRSSYTSAERGAQKAKRGLWRSCGSGAPPVPTEACAIKGNISYEGAKIYHLPGQRDYAKTIITPARGERWFCTEAEAVAAGWRRSAV